MTEIDPFDTQPQKYLDRIEIVDLCKKQIVKDFDSVGLKISFSEEFEDAYEEISSELSVMIVHMLERHRNELMNLFYRIDLPEQTVWESLSIAEHPSLDLAQKIIKRELQKVLIRKFYRP